MRYVPRLRCAELSAFATGLILAFVASVRGQTINQGGLPHTPMGGAVLTQNPDDTLTVSNIGSSGLDGVSINLGASEFARHGVSASIPALVPLGEKLVSESFGQYGELGLTSFGSLSMTDIGNELELLVEAAAIGASSFRVEGRANNLIINLSVGWEPALAPGHTATPPDAIEQYGWTPGEIPDGTIRLLWDAPVSVALGSAPPMMIDELRITPELPVELFQYVERSELTGTSAPSASTMEFTTNSVGAGVFGATVTGFGTAELSPDIYNGQIVVSNIGSSGKDGVSIQGPGNLMGLINRIHTPIGGGTGSGIGFSLFGFVDGDPDRPIVTGNMNNIGLGWSILPDFSPIGASSFTIEIYSQQVLVQTAGPTSLPILASAMPTGLGFRVEIGGLPCDFSFDGPTTIMFPAARGVGVTGDVVRFIPVSPTSTAGPIEGIDYSTTLIDPIQFTGFDATTVAHEVGHNYGMLHTALGTAQFRSVFGQVTPEPGGPRHLVVSNIGSSGKDGVSIHTGAVRGCVVRLGFDEPPPLARPIVNKTILKAYFQTGDTPTEGQFSNFIDSISLTGPEDVGVAVTDASPSGVTVELQLDGTTVDSAAFGWPPPPVLVSGELGEIVTQRVEVSDPAAGDVRTEICDFPAAALAINGRGTVLANRIIYVVTDGVSSSTASTHMTHFDLMGLNGTLTIYSEAAIHTGGVHTSLGNARIVGGKGIGDGDDFLRVSNIGSSGLDGVSIDTSAEPQARTVNSGWSIGHEHNVDAGLPGAFMRYDYGTSFEPSAQGSLQVLRVGSDVLVVPNILPLTATIYNVEVFNGAAPVGSANGLAGPAASLPGSTLAEVRGASLTMNETPDGAGGIDLAWSLEVRVNRWESVRAAGDPVPVPIDIQLPGQAPVVGDRIVITPILPSSLPPGAQVPPSQIKVILMGAVQVDITEARLRPVLSECEQADSDESGDVGIDDFLAVLARWGPCAFPCPEDGDGDGKVGIDEFLQVLARWGPCP